MLQILSHHLVSYIACAPRPVPDCPEMPPPVPLAQLRVLLLQQPRSAPLHPLHQIRHRLRRRVLDMHVDMIFAHHPFEYTHVFGVADLQKQVSASHFDVAYEHRVTIFRDPDYVCCKASDCVSAMPVVSHRARLLPRTRDV
jgi:hypothetical protein